MKSITPEEFFKRIALHSGVNDMAAVRDVYYGMIRAVSRELKEKGTVRLPDWGDFDLRVRKARKFVAVNDGVAKHLPSKTEVKFKPNMNVKKYFQTLDE